MVTFFISLLALFSNHNLGIKSRRFPSARIRNHFARGVSFLCTFCPARSKSLAFLADSRSCPAVLYRIYLSYHMFSQARLTRYSVQSCLSEAYL